MENKCQCKEQKQVMSYCELCHLYICSDCHVTKHMEHEDKVIDVAEKCTRFLVEYQKLSKTATLMADRRQVHIKDESIDGIVADIKSRLQKTKDSLQADIEKTTNETAEHILKSPLIQDFVRKKAALAGQANDELLHLKHELADVCKNLLVHIAEGRYETADRLASAHKFADHEAALKRFTDYAHQDVEFIQEIRKLRHTTVEYSYNPMAVLGMVHVHVPTRRPPRVMQFDREQNLVHIFHIETQKLATAPLCTGFILPFRFVTAECANAVFLSGGDNDHGHFLKSLHSYDELRGTLVQLADMHGARSRHALVPAESHKLLYALGGEGPTGALDTCEAYHLNDNKWTPCPSLNQPRCSLSASIVDKALYVVGGWNGEYMDSIERLGIEDDGPWILLKLGKKHGLKPLQVAGTCGTGHQLLIFGGYQENEQFTKDCFALDTQTLVLSRKHDLPQSDAFISSEARVLNGVLYSFGYSHGGLYSYDIAKDEWTHVPQGNLNK